MFYRENQGNLIQDGSFDYNPSGNLYFVTSYQYYTGTFIPEGYYSWVSSAYNVHHNGNTSLDWGAYAAREGSKYLVFNGFPTNASVWRNTNPIAVEYGGFSFPIRHLVRRRTNSNFDRRGQFIN